MKKLLLFLLCASPLMASDPTQQMIESLGSNLVNILCTLPKGMGPEGIPLSNEYLDSLKGLSEASAQVIKNSPAPRLMLGGAAIGGGALYLFSTYGGLHMVCDLKKSVWSALGYKENRMEKVLKMLDRTSEITTSDIMSQFEVINDYAETNPSFHSNKNLTNETLQTLAMSEEKSGTDNTYWREKFAERLHEEEVADMAEAHRQGTND